MGSRSDQQISQEEWPTATQSLHAHVQDRDYHQRMMTIQVKSILVDLDPNLVQEYAGSP